MKNSTKPNDHYGLLTATTMIIGIVIGSGIFFKSDDILLYTGGNVLLGVLLFCIGALSIIFGSLTITELSLRGVKQGGIIGYYEEFTSSRIANAFGWFQTFVYYPTINAVVSWVCAIYLFSLFNIDGTLELQVIVGFLLFTLMFIVNAFSYKLGGFLQNVSTVIKLVPLILIAIVGFFWKGAIPDIPADVTLVSKSNVGLQWLAALAPVAFSFDGWIISTSIAGEVKNPKKNMTLALIIGPIIVLFVYVLYFLGLNKMLGPEFIMSTRDSAVNMIGTLLLGNNGARILMTIIIIAVLGVVNGVSLGSIRLPQILASKNMLPNSEKIKVIHPKFEVSLPSVLISYSITVFWMLMHYITQKTGVLKGSDVSEISIVFSYSCYIILYIKVLKMRKNSIINSTFKGLICPIFALLGSIIILVGSLVTNPFYVICFILFCSLVCLAGFLYSKH